MSVPEARMDAPRRGPTVKIALTSVLVPFTSFAVRDVHAQTERLKAAGVTFTQEPSSLGPVATAVLDDTCGNLIPIAGM
jgi:predicted enzyme related to lactoylglutathione lyase